MKFTIHTWVLNAMTAPNPGQTAKSVKHTQLYCKNPNNEIWPKQLFRLYNFVHVLLFVAIAHGLHTSSDHPGGMECNWWAHVCKECESHRLRNLREANGGAKQHLSAVAPPLIPHFGHISIFSFYFMFVRFACLRWIRSGHGIQNTFVKCQLHRFLYIVFLLKSVFCVRIRGI